MAVATAAPSQEDATLQALRAGLPPPAYNLRCTDKTSYRFLMCGVLMAIGCMMPFSADLNQAGYKTMSGAFFLFVAVGMIWTWWGAIHNNRSTGASLKWLGLCLLPLIAQAMNLMGFDPVEALQEAKLHGAIAGNAEASTGWGPLFSDMGLALAKKVDSPIAAAKVENFFRCFGTGRLYVFFGALLAEVFFIAGIVGGAKQNKQQKQARMSQATERKRR